MRKFRFTALILTILACLAAKADDSAKVKVACIGNSITYGIGVENREQDSYPAVLQRLLGDGYEVGRFGKPGATLLRKGHNPLIKREEFAQALDFAPDIAVIHLGVNDTDPRNWTNYSEEFVPDYLALIDSLRADNPNMRIIVARITPLCASHWRFRSGTRDWRIEIQKAIEQVAIAANAEVVDFDAPLRNYPNLLPDGIHPNEEGAKLMAEAAYQAITGEYPFAYPAVLQDGMVLQRYKPLTFSGTAKPGDTVTIKLSENSGSCAANGRGQWSITLPALSEAENIAVSISHTDKATGKTEIVEFKDVAVGEVWLASGQSNMAFMLKEAESADEDIPTATDPLLRFYDMKPRALTRPGKWSDDDIAEVNHLNYFLPTHWTASTPETAADMSAIAYYLGKQLRDSLQVPVGIINNAVGGATTESWIDIESLQAGMPEALVNWTANDYVMPWAQRRAMENMGEDKKNRHPYEPSYLFAAGIEPLGKFPIAGVIWYQGESNAHKVEMHESLFDILVQSFRKNWSEPAMPFYFVQLSSIDRSTWPRFRDSQRRLMKSIANTGMAVCSDVGDSIDVHPRNKRVVGNRLAAWALHDTYSMTNVTPSGPLPVSASLLPNDDIALQMEYANGMTTSDGKPIRTVEVAAADGIFIPASDVIVDGNQLVIKHNLKLKPVSVRYGWQPFTRANLVNAAGLPASTFIMNIIDNSTMEYGWNNGISGAYAATANGNLVVAGGCNFPENPMAPNSQKKFYKGIYAANPSDLDWYKVGELPMPLAYGCSASTDSFIFMGSGCTPTGPVTDAWIVDFSETVALRPLPALPFAIDNAACCAVGDKVYIAGGNADGVPSNSLISIDLKAKDQQWSVLPPFPGNPRVQPVMAAAPDKKGNMCLWLFGGFAPKHNGKDATLDTDGYCFDIKKNKWSKVDGPQDADGNAISLGGGVAATLPSGEIFATGGVNKDIFLSALQNQAPDYLSHPIEWYKFNGKELIFNPQTLTWTIVGENNKLARAGASIIMLGNTAYIFGGELKPRIRTAEVCNYNFLQE